MTRDNLYLRVSIQRGCRSDMVFIQRVSFDIRAERYQLETLFKSLVLGIQDPRGARCYYLLRRDPASIFLKKIRGVRSALNKIEFKEKTIFTWLRSMIQQSSVGETWLELGTSSDSFSFSPALSTLTLGVLGFLT